MCVKIMALLAKKTDSVVTQQPLGQDIGIPNAFRNACVLSNLCTAV